MSKIGQKKISFPASVSVEVNKGGEFKNVVVTVKGPKGELNVDIRPGIEVIVENNEINVNRLDNNKQTKAYHGLYRSLVANMVVGVIDGYEKKLEIVGVGYRGTQKGNGIEMALGYSHKVNYEPRAGITLKMVDENNILIVGIDKQMVGQTAAEIRHLRKPEPYKGKGIRYLGEQVKRKAGKTASAK